MTVRFALLDSKAVTATLGRGVAVYRDAFPNGTLQHRPGFEGTEDWIFFEQRPAREELRYRVDLVHGIAGLRLVADTLELLDRGGIPRLRMSPPYVLSRDSAGVLKRSPATVSLAGCEVDRSTRYPRGHTPIAAGSAVCELRLSWQGVRYPAFVDPVWSTTGSMALPRYAVMARLLDGRVLVAGGSGTNGDATCEIYDPTSGTWSMTASMAANRRLHALTLLTDGRVLVTGTTANGAEKTAEVFDPSAPVPAWQSAGSMTNNRANHTATRLLGGKVLIAGPAGTSPEIFDPQAAGNPWSSAGTTSNGSRTWGAAALLQDGRVLVAGGMNVSNTNLATSEIYDPNAAGNPWSTGPTMSVTYQQPSAAVVGSNVLVVGNGQVVNVFQPSPLQFTLGAPLPDSNTGRLVSLAGGLVLETGGITASLYDTSVSHWWSVASSPLDGNARGIGLSDGRALYAGGGAGPFGGPTLSSAFLFDPTDPAVYIGGTCSNSSTCKQGPCVGGRCCAGPCSTTCSACNITYTGQPNGVCAPILAGTDPFQSCVDDGSPSCNFNGMCDGAGACGKYPSPSACTGTPCAAGSDCTSGFCVDNVCCDSACTGLCRACSVVRKGQGVDGVCDFIKAGGDPQSECTTTIGTGVCAGNGVCDGAGVCMTPNFGNVCVPTSCVGLDAQNNASLCSKTGACVANGISSCFPYVCSGIACLTSCTTQADCASGKECVANQCVTPKPNGNQCSSPGECISSFCVEGVCCDSPCDGDCESCLAANKISGSTGTCGPEKPSLCPADGGVIDAGSDAATDAGSDSATDAGSDSATGGSGGSGGTAGSAAGGSAGSSAGGSAGSTSTGGASGSAGAGGSAGSTSTGGASGSAGAGGSAGSISTGGAAGSAGAGGSAGSTSSGGASGSTSGGGSSGSTGATGGSKAKASDAEEDGGCGCRQASSGTSSWGLVALGGLLLTVRRRRRSQRG
jgi:MYXO-CTERM domain-containing protein